MITNAPKVTARDQASPAEALARRAIAGAWELADGRMWRQSHLSAGATSALSGWLLGGRRRRGARSNIGRFRVLNPPGRQAEALTLLCRGPLASCDDDCPYCPVAKRRDSRTELTADREALERFAGWVRAESGTRLSLLFTPWGEGLVRSWYRRTLAELSRLPQVHRVAIQTNLSHRTDWVAQACPETLALWPTYHPGQVGHDRFLATCRELDGHGVRYSVGVVGDPAHLDAARDSAGHILVPIPIQPVTRTPAQAGTHPVSGRERQDAGTA
ncbi:hypothetical protein ABH931_000907 [Streptacidiphilus sp. MAP12-33]